MNRQEIIEKLKEIAELTVQDPSILDHMSEASDLQTDLGLSSVGMLYIVIAIEEMFNVRMDDVSFGDFRTVGDVADYIEKNKNCMHQAGWLDKHGDMAGTRRSSSSVPHRTPGIRCSTRISACAPRTLRTF